VEQGIVMMQSATSWRRVLLEDTDNARPIVTSLLVGRVTIAPTTNSREWEMRGEGTLTGLFERTFPLGWRPRRDASDVTRNFLQRFRVSALKKGGFAEHVLIFCAGWHSVRHFRRQGNAHMHPLSYTHTGSSFP
jgi:hypothetical protein